MASLSAVEVAASRAVVGARLAHPPALQARSRSSLPLASRRPAQRASVFPTPVSQPALRIRRFAVSNSAEAATESPARPRPGEKKGFVEEMRIVAMKLHTRDQAPKEGEKVAEKEHKPLAKWEPTAQGYIQFMVDSKAVYDTIERIMKEASVSLYAEFQKTGLERAEALQNDLDWYASQGYTIPSVGEAGKKYSELLEELAKSNPQAFICHYYNIYFAHSAGGRMIGQKVSDMLFGGRVFEFYQYDGDMKEYLDGVRATINRVAEDWTREEKDVCLAETQKSFSYSGSLLRNIASGGH